MNIQDLTLDIAQSIEIKASAEDVFDALILRLTSENSTPDHRPMPMVLEAWPGGRWFRDLGDDRGHLWGFVQVIKPPALIEIEGPLFMSYPVAGHVQFRVTRTGDGVELSMRHRAFGLVQSEHREGATHGWQHLLNCVKHDAES